MNAKVVWFIPVILLARSNMSEAVKIEEGNVNVNGVQLYYKIMGEGEAVVILHGGPGFDHNHMLPFGELADEYRIVFYDQRATGNSTGATDTTSITVGNFVEDLEGLRNRLNLGKMNLIGHSWGAALAMFYGIRYPQNLKTLILLSPSASLAVFGQYLENMQKRTSPEDGLAMQQIEQLEAFKKREVGAVQKYYQIAVKPLFHDPSLADRMDFSFGKNTAKNQHVVHALLMKDFGSYDIHDKLSAIRCPTLIVHGESDALPFEVPWRVHKSIPQSKLVVLRKAGHFMFIESPRELFLLIRRFLKDDNSVETSTPAGIVERPCSP